MGAPQGGPLSPILANILLDKLDKELEKRGLRFARYADDMIVLCKSKRAATRVFESLTCFIEKKLLLRVNRKKSKIVYVGNRELKFLGYGFAPLKGRIIPTVHFRSKAKFKDASVRSCIEIRGRDSTSLRPSCEPTSQVGATTLDWPHSWGGLEALTNGSDGASV